jgi:hypothetical protein
MKHVTIMLDCGQQLLQYHFSISKYQCIPTNRDVQLLFADKTTTHQEQQLINQ